jgi:hypothetical protein
MVLNLEEPERPERFENGIESFALNSRRMVEWCRLTQQMVKVISGGM